MEITGLTQSLILHFGEMGSRWGINRTVGQIYALLVFTEEALNADQIASALGFSRSNVSMGLKELQSWELVFMQHLPGDRKDYFTVPEDVWDIARTLVMQRRKRELEPTLTVLRSQLVEQSNNENYAVERMQQIHDFMELIVGWTDELEHLSGNDVSRLMKIGSSMANVLEFARSVTPNRKSKTNDVNQSSRD